VNQDGFISRLESMYSLKNNPMQEGTRSWIRSYIGQENASFLTINGIPGAHAEVQAVNALERAAGTSFNVSDVLVSTYKTQNGFGQGSPFKACLNCGGIIPRSAKITTGR
jgi:hypothetical protein